MKKSGWGVVGRFAVLASFGLGMALPLAAKAEGLSIETSPLPVAISLEPGQSVTKDFKVRNSGSEDHQLKVSLMKFKADGDTGQADLLPRQASDDYFDWVSFDKTSFDAPPGEWQTVKMTVNVPKTAIGGGYYLAVLFSEANTTNPQPHQAVFAGSSATFVLMEVKSSTNKRAGQIADFSVDHGIFEFLPARFTVRVQDTGNVHFIPGGDIFITQGGRQVADIQVNQNLGNVLPGSARAFIQDWNDGFPVYVEQTANGKVVLDAKGQPVKKLVWDFGKLSHLRFGRFTAHVVMAYNDGQRDIPMEAELSFWVMPWRLLGGVMVVLLVLGYGLWGMARSLFGLGRRKP